MPLVQRSCSVDSVLRGIEVGEQSDDSISTVTKQPKGSVAVAAQQAANVAAVVAVVDAEDLPIGRGHGTSCADSTLSIQHGVVLSESDPVSLLEMTVPDSVAVDLSPRLMACSTLIGGDAFVPSALFQNSIVSHFWADESALPEHRVNQRSAAGAPSGVSAFDQSVLGTDPPGALPGRSLIFRSLFDGDLSAPLADRTANMRSDFAQDVSLPDVSPFPIGVPTDISDGLPLDPSSFGGCLWGDPGDRTAATVTLSSRDCASGITARATSHREDYN